MAWLRLRSSKTVQFGERVHIGRMNEMLGDWLSADVVDRYSEMSPAARLALPRALARYVATLRG